MEVQLQRDALLSIYMFFLEIHGHKVIYENIGGGKMRGGNSYFENVVVSIFMAFVVFVTINIVNALDDQKLQKTLQQASSNPKEVVDDMFLNHKQQVLQAGEKIAQRVQNGDKIEGSNVNEIINPIFKGVQSNEEVLERVQEVAADALKTMEAENFGVSRILDEEGQQASGQQASGQEAFGQEASGEQASGPEVTGQEVSPVIGQTTLRTSPNVGPFLRNYIDRYVEAVQKTNEKGKRTDGGSKKKKSKRKRGGSKKQQRRRSHKRR